jgi:hypothetical protein
MHDAIGAAVLGILADDLCAKRLGCVFAGFILFPLIA